MSEPQKISIVLNNSKTSMRATVSVPVGTKLRDLANELGGDAGNWNLAGLGKDTDVSVNGQGANKDTELKQDDEVTTAPGKIKAA